MTTRDAEMEQAISTVVKKEIQKRGLTQLKLAKQTKINQSEISMLLNNARPWGTNRIRKIAETFGMKPSEIYAKAGF
jgi:transcriptional regulator with XRE-family HTH domain